ncbi:MAG: hypothetical protein K2K20_11060 [Lachnospiraceae bacterium]|nr:hypothetical protein [Lachnospiraceae bacterium]
MKKKKKLVVGLLVLCLMGISLTGCGQESKDEEEGILLSEQKVRIEVGDEVEVEIENFDDLKRVEVEVEDDDIAEIDFDDEDGIITIEGISPGKTTVTVSAKGEDDVSFKVTVEESEDARSDADEPDDSRADADEPDDSSSIETPAPSADQEAEEVAGDYVSSYNLDSDFWIDVTGDTESADFLEKGNLTLDFIMSLDSDGTAQLNMDIEKFASDLVNFIDDNYIEFACILVERDWDDLTQEEKEELEGLKDFTISSLEEAMIESMDESSDLATGTWEYADGNLYFTFDGNKESVPLNSGSFVIDVPSGDTFGFGNDSLVFTKVN